MDVINITIEGRIPSKKNSKRVYCRGKYPVVLPSEAHEAWHADAMTQLRKQKIPKAKLKRVDVHYWLYAPDRRKADYTNKIESVNDLLVDYGFLEDDNYFVIEDTVMHKVEIDRENPRIEIEFSVIHI